MYVLPVLAGVSASAWAPGLEKASAVAITALSVVFLFWALAELVSRRWALVVAAIYAFGTSSWSVSSQALWQHGPSQLFLTFFLFCLVRGMKEQRFLAYAGFAMSSAIVMRPTDVLIALPGRVRPLCAPSVGSAAWSLRATTDGRSPPLLRALRLGGRRGLEHHDAHVGLFRPGAAGPRPRRPSHEPEPRPLRVLPGASVLRGRPALGGAPRPALLKATAGVWS